MKKEILNVKCIIIFILINILIFCSYFILLSKSGFHGNDDFLAVTSEYNPDITFTEKLHQVIDRAKCWNLRMGEILCFSIGALPVNIIFFIIACIMVVLINLITYFAIGKREYKNKEKASICNLVTYIIFLAIYPATAEVFFLYSSFCNHVISIVIFLIILIPYKNIMDGEDRLNKFNLKYLLYIFLCLISGFNSEIVVLNTIFILGIYNLYYVVKNKKIDIIKFLPLMTLIVSFLIIIFCSQHRISFFIEDYELDNLKNRVNMFLENRLIQILTLFILNILYFILYKFDDIDNFKKVIFMVAVSLFSIICMYFVPYYSNRRINNV